MTDGLTGLYNHAYFLQALRQEVLRSKRHGLKAALLLLDLDDFKRVNDVRGHVEGDRVLMKAAAIVRDSVREIDVAARYGGEEFAVLLPDTSRLGAFVVAERIRRRVEERFAPRARGRHDLGRDRGLPRRRGDARPTSSCRPTPGSTGPRPRARTASCFPRASGAGPAASPRRSGVTLATGERRGAGPRQERLRGRPAREPARAGGGGQPGEPVDRAARCAAPVGLARRGRARRARARARRSRPSTSACASSSRRGPPRRSCGPAAD